jgi:hypothetical protein
VLFLGYEKASEAYRHAREKVRGFAGKYLGEDCGGRRKVPEWYYSKHQKSQTERKELNSIPGQ